MEHPSCVKAMGAFSLAPHEPPSVTIVNPSGVSEFVLTCDHASNRLPECIKSLGLSLEEMSSHIAWDPGALDVARELSQLLGATLIHSNYSRLLVDLNRPTQSEGHITQSSAGIAIPGNMGLSAAHRRQRDEVLFFPYHDAIASVLDQKSKNSALKLVAIHSFTPDYPGEVRPWHFGITHRRDSGLGARLVEALRSRSRYMIGDNEPYQINDVDDMTIPVHGERRGLPNVLVEIRQDILLERDARSEIAYLLCEVLNRIG